MVKPRKSKVTRASLADQLREIIRARIFDRVYLPGERLQIDGLAKELDVSATPVREALGWLAAEGLAQSEPYVGYTVAPLPDHDFFIQLYEFRLLLEPWAGRIAAQRRPRAGLTEMQEALAQMEESGLSRTYRQYHRFAEADAAFHRAIFVCAENEPALKAFTDLRTHLHLSRLYIQREQNTQETRRFHQAIYNAIKKGDASAAASQIRLHLQHSKHSLLDSESAPNSLPTTTTTESTT